jgi:hypothetical protein
MLASKNPKVVSGGFLELYVLNLYVLILCSLMIACTGVEGGRAQALSAAVIHGVSFGQYDDCRFSGRQCVIAFDWSSCYQSEHC